MISKRPTVRSLKGGGGKVGGMKGLVHYLTRSKVADMEPISGSVRVTNSSAYTLDDFLVQAELVQRRNASEQNKVYHLVVSFPAGERPSPEALADIEQTLCESINAGEHQRLSVVHDDTDCLHLHVAINRVHPTTHKLNSIHQDYVARQAACELLEIKHGLSRTSHEMKRSAAEDRARNVKHHHGETPLIERARALAPGLMAANSWAEIHTQLADQGMTVRLRGAGLVIEAEGVHVKASSVAKGFSLGKLQDRLGAFQPSQDSGRAGEQRAPNAPLGRNPDGAAVSENTAPSERRNVYRDLRQQFYQDRAITTAQRSETWGAVREERAAAVQAVRAAATERLAGLETISPGAARWALSAAVRQEQAEALVRTRAVAAERAAEARRKLSARPPVSWIDWLRARAAAGDREALAILRGSGVLPSIDGASSIAGGATSGGAAPGHEGAGRVDEAASSLWQDRLSHVSRRGVVIYNLGQARVRDDGDRLHLQGERTDEAIAVALQLAKERHGSTLNIQGDLAFRSRVAHVAARIDPSIRFDDPKTERLRTASVVVRRERRDDDPRGPGHRAPGRPGADIGARTAGSGVGAAEPLHVPTGGRSCSVGADAAYNGGQTDRTILASLRGRFTGGGIRPSVTMGSQPNLAAAGATATAADRGAAWPGRSLRDMPRLDMVRRPDHGSVPLPASDGGDLGDRHVDSNLAMRRPGAGDRVGPTAAPGGLGEPSAVEAYVSERNATRERVRGLAVHRPYEPVDSSLTFEGRRVVEGKTLALLGADGEVLVMEVRPGQSLN
ncbi:MAG: TraI/MobA(P) family conjugative relaxase [Caulobacteraceae bacterium]